MIHDLINYLQSFSTLFSTNPRHFIKLLWMYSILLIWVVSMVLLLRGQKEGVIFFILLCILPFLNETNPSLETMILYIIFVSLIITSIVLKYKCNCQKQFCKIN